MTKSAALLALFGFMLVLWAPTPPAHAQGVSRTWVSGTGNDGNDCSRGTPCQTFAGAYGKTLAGGEIDVLDPGGYGALTITGPISIYNDGVGEAGILVSGANGIVISAGASDVVNLRGLIFNGSNSASPDGIDIVTAGRVSIQNCVIQQFTTGIGVLPASGTVDVKIQDTTITGNGTGMLVKPSGGAIANVAIDRAQLDNNTGGGLRVDGTGGGTVTGSLSDSSVSLNSSNGVNSVGGAGNSKIDLTRDVIASNGLAGIQSNGGTSTVTVGSSMLSNNGTATNAVGGGALLSFGNNQVTGPAGTGFSGGIGPQ